MEHHNPLLSIDTDAPKFITCGEIMLRLTPPNYEKIRMASSFEASYGGSEANIALALANLGVDSTFFSVVPNNSLGKSAVRMLRSNDVHCTPMILATQEDVPTHRLGTYYLETGYGIRASKVTYDRLTAASDSKRVPGALVTEDLKSLDNDAIKNTTLDEEPKYDAFVRDYLFPIPEDAPSADSSTWNQSYELYPGVEGTPVRPKRLRDAIIQSEAGGNNTFAAKLMAYNTNASSSDKLGQNDMTTLVSIGNETFGDRQQLFLYILRADAIAYNSGRDLSQHKPLSTARAVALVWRDAYGELPDRIIYWQYLP